MKLYKVTNLQAGSLGGVAIAFADNEVHAGQMVASKLEELKWKQNERYYQKLPLRIKEIPMDGNYAAHILWDGEY